MYHALHPDILLRHRSEETARILERYQRLRTAQARSLRTRRPASKAGA